MNKYAIHYFNKLNPMLNKYLKIVLQLKKQLVDAVSYYQHLIYKLKNNCRKKNR